ncbi:MAG: ABC transporter permease [Bacteroidales bacterium]|jgi:ABC-type multidrug transport system permease subunit|nr:ABC transporter permease [Bacteroidales bacterium]
MIRAILSREMKIFFKSFPKIIIASAMLPFLLLITFGKIVGNIVPTIDNIDYLTYVSYSLAVITSMVVSTFVTGFEYQADFKGTKNIENLVVAPSTTWEILLGKSMSYGIKGICSGIAFLLISLAVGARIEVWYGLIVCIIPLFITGVLFSLISTILACITNSYDEMAAMLNIIVFPCMLLSQTFFSPDILSNWASNFIYISPLYYNVAVFRSICLGNFGITEMINLIISFLYLFFILKIAILTFNKKIKL